MTTTATPVQGFTVTRAEAEETIEGQVGHIVHLNSEFDSLAADVALIGVSIIGRDLGVVTGAAQTGEDAAADRLAYFDFIGLPPDTYDWMFEAFDHAGAATYLASGTLTFPA